MRRFHGAYGFARTLFSSFSLVVLASLMVSACAFDPPKARLLSSAQAQKLASVEIVFPLADYPIRVERRKDDWFLVLDDTHRYPANSLHVSSFIQALRGARATRVLDQNDDAHGIDPETSPRIRAEAASGDVSLDLLAGTVTAANTAQYFHDGLTGRTIRVEPPLDAFIDRTTAYWADLTPFAKALHGGEIERVVYRRGNYQSALVRRSDGTDSIDSFQHALAALSCIDVTNIPVTSTESLTLEKGDMSSMEISIMSVNENYAIIRRESDGAAWIIAETARIALIGFF